MKTMYHFRKNNLNVNKMNGGLIIIMEIVKIGVKAAISLAVGIFVVDGNIVYRGAIFAICYALLTYYMWYMKRRGGGFSVFVGKGGIFATLFSFGFMIISPIIPLIVLAFALSALGMPEAVEGVLSILLIIVASAFVVFDIGRAVNPNFLKRGDNCKKNKSVIVVDKI